MNCTLDQPTNIKLILHTGHDKCGSSSIQSFLYSNFDELNKQGVYLPDRNFKFSFETSKTDFELQSPIFYFKELIERNDFISFENRLREVLNKAKISNCKAILISAENLSNGNAIRKGKQIHEILAYYFEKRFVIYYVRRQDDFLVSSWQQWGHKTGTTLKEYIDESLDKYNPDFLVTINFLEEIYGEDNVTLIPLHKKAFSKGSLITDFCERCQLNICNQNNIEIQKNKSLNPYLCEILRHIPHIYQNVHDSSIKNLLMSYVETEEILFANQKNILNEEQRNKILLTFQHDNHIISEKYFNNLCYEDIWVRTVESDLVDYSQIEQLKDVIALQMELIINLLKEQEKKEYKQRRKFILYNRLKQTIKTYPRKIVSSLKYLISYIC